MIKVLIVVAVVALAVYEREYLMYKYEQLKDRFRA